MMSSNAVQLRQKRWLLIALLTLGGAFLIFQAAGWLASARDAAKPRRDVSLPLVETVSAQPLPQNYAVTEDGFLRPRAQIDIIPEIAGRVVEVADKLRPGGQFAKGELIFRIDPRTYEADLGRAKADLAAARADFARAKDDAGRQERLVDIGAVSTARQQQASAALASAQARIEQAQAALTQAAKRREDTEIRAPFDASVISEDLAEGRFVQPGQAVATVFATGAGEIVLGLLPDEARAVRRAAAASKGPLAVKITPSGASATGSSLTGTIKSFGGAVDQRSRTVPLVVEVPGAFGSDHDEPVFANDYVRVEVPARAPAELFALPNGVVREESFIWVLNNESSLHKVAIQEVQRTSSETIVTSAEPLSGRAVVLTALTEEAEGLKVDVAERPKREASLR